MDTLPFELHLTTGALPLERETAFLALCEEQQGKPLLIELQQGAHVLQPMFSRIVDAVHLEDAVHLAGIHARSFRDRDFPIKRIKIEIPAFAAGRVTPEKTFRPYFEWHGKIAYERVPELEALCTAHKVHLSRNALKHEQGSRFLTLREYGTQAVFLSRLSALKQTLQLEHRPCIKEQSEYCVYDDNQQLDTGWLPS